jgi:broad specificity phosphatase PhoE
MGIVLLVRHGQASFGAEDYDVLNDTGVEQSGMLGRALAAQGVVPAAVVHGGMKRQRDTATGIIEGGGWSVTPEIDGAWDEFDHAAVIRRIGESGRFDGLDRAAFHRVFEEATDRWSGGAHDDEYDEPWPSFLSRSAGALDRACSRPGVTLVVSSGGPIAAACTGLVDVEAHPEQVVRLWKAFDDVIVNASVTRVVVGSRGRRLLSFNEHSHLPRELITYW